MSIILRHLASAQFLITTLIVAFIVVSWVGAEESLDPDDPMASFSRLVGGRWVLGDTYHTFEWGVGQKTILARSYALNEGGEELTAEDRWFWHPAEETIKGFTIALGMPFELLESNTRFEENRMVSELMAVDAGGNVSAYVETMKFVDDDRYEWNLYRETSEGRQGLMGGTFTRQVD